MPKYSLDNRFNVKSLFEILLAFVLFTTIGYCEETDRYYLHISSYRAEEGALKDAKAYRAEGYEIVTHKETVSGKGEWFRNFIGPFDSFNQANTTRNNLLKNGIVAYAKVYQRRFGHADRSQVPKVSSAKEITASSSDNKDLPTVSEKIQSSSHIATAIQEEENSQLLSKSSAESVVSGNNEDSPHFYGRNLPKGKLGLDFRHAYRRIPTTVTDRKMTTSNGIITTTSNVPLNTLAVNDFPTTMHADLVRVRWGLFDTLEIFAETGAAYKQLSSLRPAYGGGFRLNIFQQHTLPLSGLFASFEGSYLGGKLDLEYTSNSNDKWHKTSSWDEFDTRLELGWGYETYCFYTGISALYYREDTRRELLDNLPSGYTGLNYQDELKQENSFGIFGGGLMMLSPDLSIKLEGQLYDQYAINCALEYLF